MEKMLICKVQRTQEGEWDKNREYDIFCDVIYQGDTYTSRKYVPKGIEISNDEYWIRMASHDQQVEHLRDIIENVQQELQEDNRKQILNYDGKLAETRIDINQRINSIVNDFENRLNNLLQNKLNKDEFIKSMSKLTSLSPKGVFESLEILNTTFPNGNNDIYVIGDSWYFYNGTWTKGGIYNTNVIGEKSIEPIHCTFFENYSIPFDKIYGKVLQPTGQEQSNESFITSDFIRIDEGNYAINLDCKVHMYDSTKTWIKLVSVNNNSFLVDGDISFIRFTYRSELDNDNICLCNGNIPKSLNECTPNIKEEYIKNNSYWKGKSICFYGDSIVQQDKFPKLVSNELKLKSYYNWGIGGTRYQSDDTFVNAKVINGKLNILNNNVSSDFSVSDGELYQRSLCSARRIETIPNDIDCIVIFAGTNDYGSNSIINNDFSVFDDNFEGSIIKTIKTIRKKFHTIPIFVCSPIYARSSNKLNTDLPEKNSLGYSVDKYGKVLKEICNIMGVNYIPVGEESEIGFYNLESYLLDGVHPNDEGNKNIARVIIKYLNMYKK